LLRSKRWADMGPVATTKQRCLPMRRFRPPWTVGGFQAALRCLMPMGNHSLTSIPEKQRTPPRSSNTRFKAYTRSQVDRWFQSRRQLLEWRSCDRFSIDSLLVVEAACKSDCSRNDQCAGQKDTHGESPGWLPFGIQTLCLHCGSLRIANAADALKQSTQVPTPLCWPLAKRVRESRTIGPISDEQGRWGARL
jgi:hypothetical protein